MVIDEEFNLIDIFDKIKKSQTISGLFHEYHNKLLIDDKLSDTEVLLLCIYILDKYREKASYKDCQNLFVAIGRRKDNFRKALYAAKRQSIQEDNNILSLLSWGLKTIQNFLGNIGKSPVYIFKAGENFTAIKHFEEFLISEMQSGEIFLCDAHVSPNTLYPFSVLKNKKITLNLLTTNLYENDKLKLYRKNFEKETGIKIEIKLNKKIHERYLICGGKCWSLGSSIKDLGNKDGILKEVSEIKQSMQDLFEYRWSEAENYQD